MYSGCSVQSSCMPILSLKLLRVVNKDHKRPTSVNQVQKSHMLDKLTAFLWFFEDTIQKHERFSGSLKLTFFVTLPLHSCVCPTA